MKIVIDIPEKYLNSSSGIIDVTLFTGENNAITDVNVEDYYAKFQVLPEGHGDLIDRNFVVSILEREVKYAEDPARHRTLNYVLDVVIDGAKTVVEADNETYN